MATVCQVYDEATATVLFDLNDPTAANVIDNGYTSTQLFQTVDLGSPEWQFDRFSPPQRDGGSTSFKRAGFRVVTLPFRMRASTYDNLAQAMGRLNRYITAGCVIRWRNDGSAHYRYIDVEPSSNAYFLDGRELTLYLATTQVDTPDGIQLVLAAQPYLRGDELDSASNKLTNATLLRDADAAGTPDGWVWDSTVNITTQNIDAAWEAFEFTVATAAARNLQQTTAAATAASGDIWTFSFDARSPDATAVVQAVVRYNSSAPADLGSDFTSSLTTLTTGWQRITVTTTAAPATTDRVKVSLRVDNADATSRTIQFRNAKVEEAAAATPFTVGNEAGAGEFEPTSGMGWWFPVYNPGDAPAPVKMRFANTTQGVTWSYIGSATNRDAVPGSGDLVPILSGVTMLQWEDGTNGVDTVVNTSADSSPGSGNTGKKTTFVTTTDQTRVTLSITTNLDVFAGRTFIPILRLTAADATYTGNVYLLWSWGASVTLIEHPAIPFTALATGSTYGHVAMEPLSFPAYIPDAMTFLVRADRTAGTGNVIWDALLLVPTDLGFTNMTSQGSGGTAGNTIATDPEAGLTYSVDSSGLATAAQNTNGPLPMYAPPGLSLIHAISGSLGQTTEPFHARAIRTNALVMRTIVTPRYY